MLPPPHSAYKPLPRSDGLQDVIVQCSPITPTGDCSQSPYGPMPDWDVSAFTDMRHLFYGTSAFNQDLSKWDVSAVTNIAHMFYGASAFNQDLSKWDVSAVKYMWTMFYGASAFNRQLCSAAWVNSEAQKKNMFTNSPGSISRKVCTTTARGNGEGDGQGSDDDHLPLVECVCACVCVCVYAY